MNLREEMSWHGCLTGDCPHSTQAECDASLAQAYREIVSGSVELEHRSIHHERTQHPSSALEKAFAEQWLHENTAANAGTTRILDALMRAAGTIDKNMMSPLGDSRPYHFGDAPTQRDATVAATVIQWLGSNVGRCFIEQALKRDGRYRLVADPVKISAREAQDALSAPKAAP